MAAFFSSVNVHDCKVIQAVAKAADGTTTTWLELQFNDEHDACHVGIFMPLDRAERLAAAINAAEQAQSAKAAQSS